MSLKVTKIILVLTIAASSFALDFQRLSDGCLQGNLTERQDLQCSTQKGVRIQTSRKSGQTFYCVSYEKKTGNKNEFDILSFDLPNDDYYDLKFVSIHFDWICRSLNLKHHSRLARMLLKILSFPSLKFTIFVRAELTKESLHSPAATPRSMSKIFF